MFSLRLPILRRVVSSAVANGAAPASAQPGNAHQVGFRISSAIRDH